MDKEKIEAVFQQARRELTYDITDEKLREIIEKAAQLFEPWPQDFLIEHAGERLVFGKHHRLVWSPCLGFRVEEPLSSEKIRLRVILGFSKMPEDMGAIKNRIKDALLVTPFYEQISTLSMRVEEEED